jgi:hypothetical protein
MVRNPVCEDTTVRHKKFRNPSEYQGGRLRQMFFWKPVGERQSWCYEEGERKRVLYTLRKRSHTISQISSSAEFLRASHILVTDGVAHILNFSFSLCTFSTGCLALLSTQYSQFSSPLPQNGIREYELHPRTESSNSISNSQFKLSCTRLKFVAKVSYFNFQVCWDGE